jgi:hypothetical protein
MSSLFLLSILFLSCGKETDPMQDCHEYELKHGPFSLRESTRDLFPYSEHDSILVFKDEDNKELIFRMTSFIKDTFPFITSIACPFDTNVIVPYYIENEMMQVNYTNDSLNISINFGFNASFRHEDETITGQFDLAGVYLNSHEQNLNAQVTTMIVHKSGELPLLVNNYFETLMLGSKTFNMVYSNYSFPLEPLEMKVYMNHAMGILGFEDTAENHLWVFDRIE